MRFTARASKATAAGWIVALVQVLAMNVATIAPLQARRADTQAQAAQN